MSSSNKRYYWLKLKANFFEDDTIQWLEEQENGKEYVIFYLKLALKSLDDNGRLVRYVGETLLPYDVKALAKLTSTSPDTVAVAMKIFIEIGLVSRLDGGEIYMNQIDEMVGSETLGAEKMRRLRAEKNAKKQIENTNCNNVTESYPELLEIEKELERELEIEKDIELQQDEKTENKKDDAAVADYKLVFNFYQDNFGVLSPHIGEDLKVWVDDIGIDLVMEAMKKAIENQKNYSYAVGILRNWVKNNIKTLDDVRAEEVAFNNKNKKRFNNSKPRKKETLPDWATEEQAKDEVAEEPVENSGELSDRLASLRAARHE